MVQHEINTGAYPPFLHTADDLPELRHIAQPRLHRQIIRNSIAAIIVPLAGLQERHKMHIGNSQFGKVIQLFLHAIQVPAEMVCIKHNACHFFRKVPAVALCVLLPQPFRTFCLCFFHNLQKLMETLFGNFAFPI